MTARAQASAERSCTCTFASPAIAASPPPAGCSRSVPPGPRARAGEAREASRTSIEDMSSSRRGGLRSHRGPGGRTYAQLYEEARRRGVRGRSKMKKMELEEALKR
jgi:hypothetical protein